MLFDQDEPDDVAVALVVDEVARLDRLDRTFSVVNGCDGGVGARSERWPEELQRLRRLGNIASEGVGGVLRAGRGVRCVDCRGCSGRCRGRSGRRRLTASRRLQEVENSVSVMETTSGEVRWRPQTCEASASVAAEDEREEAAPNAARDIAPVAGFTAESIAAAMVEEVCESSDMLALCGHRRTLVSSERPRRSAGRAARPARLEQVGMPEAHAIRRVDARGSPAYLGCRWRSAGMTSAVDEGSCLRSTVSQLARNRPDHTRRCRTARSIVDHASARVGRVAPAAGASIFASCRVLAARRTVADGERLVPPYPLLAHHVSDRLASCSAPYARRFRVTLIRSLLRRRARPSSRCRRCHNRPRRRHT